MESRKQSILKAVVHEFVSSATPVGSQSLVARHFLNLSSATIRSELSELSELGYLVQPHTSAGRVPTDSGYRYFVDFLMDLEQVGPEMSAYIQHELRGAPGDAQALVEKVAATTASVTQNAAVVSAPHGPQARIKHVDLVSLEPTEVLVILLVEGNLIRQQVIELEAPAEQAELSRLAAKINRDLKGKDRDALKVQIGKPAGGTEKRVLEHLFKSLEVFERGTETLVVHDGVRNLLRQPEFAESSKLHEVLEVLEETKYLAALLQELVGQSDLQIVIGSENMTSQLRSCTVILTTYGPSNQMKGVLGVVGPTRIHYGQLVGRLRAVARVASGRMAELHA